MATLNLNGHNVTLPDNVVFTTSYLTGSNDVTNNNAGSMGNATLTEGGGGAGNIYSGIISDGTAGTTAITQTSGFVEFTADNTYSGGTNLMGGTIGVDSNSALGTGMLVMAAGTTLQDENNGSVFDGLQVFNNITINGAVTFDDNGGGFGIDGVVSGTGSLTLTGSDEVSMVNNNTYSGGTYLAEGALAVFTNTCLGTGTLTIAVGAELDTPVNGVNLANNIYLPGNAGIGPNGSGHIITLSGIISGPGDFVVVSSEIVTLDGANTNSGPTYIGWPQPGVPNGATIILGNSAAFGTSTVSLNSSTLQAGIAGLMVANNFDVSAVATLDTEGFTMTLSGVISDYPATTGSLDKIDTGTLVLDGANTYSGGTTVSAGTLALGNSHALGSGSLTLDAGTTLQAGAAGLVVANAITVAGSVDVDTNSNTFTLSGVISGTGSLTKIDSGTLVLSAAETYSGGTTVSAGTLRLGNSNALGSGSLTLDAGATLQAGAAGLIVANAITAAGPAVVDTNGNSFTLSGVISGTGSLTKINSGTLVLSAAETYSGGTTVNAGTLELANGGSIGGLFTFGNAGVTLQFDTGTSQLGGPIEDANGDTIDLRFQTFAAGDKAVWQQNGSVGTLNLETSAGTVLDSLTLAGRYTSSDFSVVGDGHNGTDINVSSFNSPPLPTPDDFNGDGITDLLLQNGNNWADWTLQPYTPQHGYNIGSAGSWTVVGTGDFTGNGITDVVLQNGSSLAEWLFQGGAYQGQTTITNGGVPPGWNVIGTGDFNDDGTTDLLLQNGSNLAAWTMKNGALQAGYNLGTLPTGWSVIGTGDFNGDGNTDLLLQDGANLADWVILNGTHAGGSMLQNANGGLATLPTGWSVVGIGDFTGDGTSDLLLQNGNQLADWTIKNNAVQNINTIGTLPGGWSVAGIGDFSGNGTAGLLLQNGPQLVIWTMQNGLPLQGYLLTTLPGGWNPVQNNGLVS